MVVENSKLETRLLPLDQPLLPSQHQVYVIDDDLQIRQSLHFLLSSAGHQCRMFSSASDFLEHLPNLTPSLILLDIRMKEISGIQLLTILADRGIAWPVIMMTAHGDIATAVQTMQLGASEFLEKPFELEMLEAVLQRASKNLFRIQAAEEAKRNSKSLFDTLTSREYEVVSQLAAGSPNKAVAFSLSLSPRTVEMHRSNALAKLGVKSIAEVLHLAADGSIDLTPAP
jgi:two-component system response regulator FixJ